MEDKFTYYNFNLIAYDRQVNVLKKYNLTEEIELPIDQVDDEDKYIFSELMHAGFVAKFKGGYEYYTTTIFGDQLLEKIYGRDLP